MKETWNEINTVIGKSKNATNQTTFTDESNNKISDPQDIANQFNDFFVNVGPNLAGKIPNAGKNYYYYLSNMKTSSMFMKPVVEDDILKIINKFDLNNSAGHDGIGNFIAKKISKEIAKPLTSTYH